MKLWFLSRRALIYHREKLRRNCRKKFINKEKKNFDKEEMLGCQPVKIVGSRDKIGYGKEKLAEICDAAIKEKLERVLNADNDKVFFPNFKNIISFVFTIMYLGSKTFLCKYLCPWKTNKVLRFYYRYGFCSWHG